MAIKIAGTTVIDDSRNTNTGILTATSAIVGSAVTVNASGINASTGIITASSFSGSGSGLTGVSTNFRASIGIQSAGTVIGAGITQLNFIGAGNTFAVNGTTVNISIAGGGGGSGVSSTGIVTCRGISNAEDITSSLTLTDFYGSGTNYAMVGPITVTGSGTTVTVGLGVSYVVI